MKKNLRNELDEQVESESGFPRKNYENFEKP